MNLANIQLDKQKKILIVIFCIFIVYVDITYILKAQLTALDKLTPKIIRLENDLKNLNRDLGNMHSAESKQGLPVKKPALKSSKILSEGQIPGLLQDISNEANKLGIKIKQMRPSREVQTVKSIIPVDKLTTFLINLDLMCDYHSLGKFINVLENSEVFMVMQELKISTQLPDYLKQKVALVVKTYAVK
ncbi:MAG: type 4a pilus biogenesis protein PilO [Candidatus Omnitrophota bacterium]|nr:type 4a pilus biogenesis protein PilO [Candidatus Omnitrophota bacterium]